MEYLNIAQLIWHTTEPKVTDTEYGKIGRFGIYTKRYAGKGILLMSTIEIKGQTPYMHP